MSSVRPKNITFSRIEEWGMGELNWLDAKKPDEDTNEHLMEGQKESDAHLEP